MLTYAGLTPDGKSQRPSNLMGEVGKLFPGMKTLDEHSVEWPVRTGRDARELLIQGLRGMQEHAAQRPSSFSAFLCLPSVAGALPMLRELTRSATGWISLRAAQSPCRFSFA